MKKIYKKFLLLSITSLLSLASFSQNQLYWTEGFEPGVAPACDLPTVAPTASGGAYFNGNAGSWYGFNVYRTTGTGCPAGNPHVRYRNISGVTDSGYLVTPIVYNGIQEFRVYRARASRSYTIWMTTDTLATTPNWVPVVLMRSSAATVVCNDTTVIIASATAKRLKIVCRPGTDTDVDSIRVTSFSAITPVTFGGVSASENIGIVKLNFGIESEVNMNSYIIERSANGDNFTQVGNLNATKASVYNWVDNSPNTGLNYYRIKAIDKNGKQQYSNVVRINIGKTRGGLSIYPNPVKGSTANIELNGVSAGDYKVNIFNMSGALVHTAILTSGGTNVAKAIVLPANVNSGNYTLEVSNGTFKSAKIISVQ
ncbi:MAG: T9SS type A sorting domain-containing protein [Chitinophagaceae bacterium]